MTGLHIPDIGDDTDPLTAALAYADAGWYTLPVKSGTKKPGSIVGDGWPSLSSRDPKTITAWFAGTSHGIALHCGRSGAVVLDVDEPDNIPDAIAAAIETTSCPYQSTRPNTPGRGHYLFTNTTGRRIGNGLGQLATTPKWGEIRGANGVIIVAPTIHPDHSGRYRWERSGPTPPLPDYLAEALPNSTTPESTASDADIEHFLTTHTETLKPEALTGLTKALTAKLAAGHSCHMSTLGVLTDAMAEAAAGYYDARTATRQLYPIYRDTVTTGTSTGRVLTKAEAAQQYKGIVAWAIGQAEAGAAKARDRITAKYGDSVTDVDTEDLTPQHQKTLEDIEEHFWTARPELNLIYTAALSRMASPWATLACCAARIITQIPPGITLPPVIGGRGSLNWFAAISAKSGGGKGAAMTVSAELVPEPVNIHGIGSGEGMIETYRRSGEPEDAVTEVMFSVDEIDTIAAMRGRSGQTTMTILRQGFSGERLGFSYRSRQNESVAAHSYRMTLVAAVQPARAGALFDDAAGGTPQRFMWFPGRDRRITEDTPPWPTDAAGNRLTLPAVPLRALASSIGDVGIPDAVAVAIKKARAASMRGDDNAMDGHSLFCREKFAYFLAVINGRTAINDDDWKLSGIAANVSDWCRTKAQSALIKEQVRISRERGAQRAVEKDECDVVSQITLKTDITRIVIWIIKTLTTHGPQKFSELNRRAAHRDRVRLQQAIDSANAKGLISFVDGKWVVTP